MITLQRDHVKSRLDLIEIRFHGRGGQGAVTAVRILASAVHLEGKYTQAIPMYGTERRGAPVVAFCRIDNSRIRERDLVHDPDMVVVLDPLLGKTVDVTEGLKPSGLALINHPGTYKETGLSGDFRVATVDATKIALETLGRPITNTAILGAFAKASGLLRLKSLEEAIKSELPSRITASNVEAARRAFEGVSEPHDASNLPKAERVKKAFSKLLISYSREVSDWRVFHPVIDGEHCVGCKRCWIYCPEAAITMKEGKAEVNYDYCKGCGICIEECRVGAIKPEREAI
jgi:2-oxoacid:acceptor oxidoreductase gamma subunit (pyruvate/2-ketoisovalerate family)/2-oxoacid:acceptor oxidoreductase delta subunit (pyruvate/2-ketoisovalerate family)